MKQIVLALLAFWLFPGPPAAAADKVTFGVRVLAASTQDEVVDPQIDEVVRAYLKKSFGNRYTSFRQLDQHSLQVEREATGEVTLPDRTVLGLRFRDVQGKFVKLTMSLGDLRTTIRIKDGGLFFQAGHRYQDGVLILAISALLGKGEEKEQELSIPRPNPRPAGVSEEPQDPKNPTPRSGERPIEQ